MSPDPSAAPPAQFTLRGLAVMMTALSVLFALCAAMGAAGAVVGLVGGGLALALFSLARGNKHLLVAGLLLCVVAAGLHFVGLETPVKVNRRTVVLTVQVVDGATGSPVEGAAVTLAADDLLTTPSTTDSGGSASPAASLTITSGSGSGRSIDCYVGDRELVVEAEGYHTYRANLAQLLGRSVWDLSGPPLPAVTAKLRPRDDENPPGK